MVSGGCVGGPSGAGDDQAMGDPRAGRSHVPALPSDTRSGVQPDSPLRLYRHRHRGAEAWDLLPGGCVGAARKRGGPSRGHRGSNRSGPDPAPWRSLSSALSDPYGFPLRPWLLHRTPVSRFRAPLPPPPEALLPPSVSLGSPKVPAFFRFLCLSPNTPLFLPSGFYPLTSQTPLPVFCRP